MKCLRLVGESRLPVNALRDAVRWTSANVAFRPQMAGKKREKPVVPGSPFVPPLVADPAGRKVEHGGSRALARSRVLVEGSAWGSNLAFVMPLGGRVWPG